MVTTVRKKIFLSIIFILILVLVIWIVAVFYINNTPGRYEYTVDIRGLEKFQAGSVTDIIVPLPVRDGQQVFTDDQLQNQSFGTWTSGIAITPQGKMLEFQSSGGKLTDLHAEFSRTLLERSKIKNITADSLSPVLPYYSSPYTQWVYGSGAVRNYSTFISVPDSLQPLYGGNDTIAVSLELIATGGTQRSVPDTTYRVMIQENLPLGARNMIHITAQIGTLANDLWIPVPVL